MSKIIECYGSHLTSPCELYLIRYSISVSFMENGAFYTNVFRERFPVIKETAHMYMIDAHGQTKYVHKDQSGKRFAYLTDEYAIRSLRIRTAWRKTYAHNAVRIAEEASRVYTETFENKDADNGPRS